MVFDPYVQLETTSTADHPNVRYVNRLTGVSAEMIANLGDGEKLSKAQVWASIKDQAYQAFRQDLKSAIADKVDFGNVIHETGDVHVQNTPSTIAPNGQRWGNRYTVLNAKYLETHIKGVYVNYHGTTGNVTITVTDLQRGTTEEVFTGELSAGLQYVEIGRTYYEHRNKIDLVLLVTLPNGAALRTFDMEANEGDFVWFTGASLAIGADVTGTNLQATLTTNVGSSGVAMEATTTGSVDAFIKNYAQHLSVPFWYLCGKMVVGEILHSHRLNIWTTLNRQMAEDNYEKLKGNYWDSLRKEAKALPTPKNLLLFTQGIERQGYEITSNV